MAAKQKPAAIVKRPCECQRTGTPIACFVYEQKPQNRAGPLLRLFGVAVSFLIGTFLRRLPR